MEKISLRYFDCRGRAQAIRFYLAEKDILFRDVRVPLENISDSWGVSKKDPEVAGLLGKLPIVEWGDLKISETMVISCYLHNKFDSYKYTAKQNLLVKTIISSVYTDIIIPLGTLIWLDIIMPKSSTKDYLLRTIPNVEGLFERYEQILTNEKSSFLGGDQPTIADYFTFEAIQIFLKIFKFREKFFQTGYPQLTKMHEKLIKEKGVATCINSIPEQITGRPNEKKRILEIEGMTIKI